MAMFRNARLRLLMSLAGFERLGAEDVLGASWIVPSAMGSTELDNIKSVIEKTIENPVSEIDGDDPRKQIRRKPTRESRETLRQSTLDVNFGSDSEGEDHVPDGPLFLPNIRSRSNALEELKENRRKRRQRDEDKEELDEAVLEERRRNREANARAREAKIKSDLFIHASDDESDQEADQEFFQREEETRKAQTQRIKEALRRVDEADETKTKKKGRKRAGLDYGDNSDSGSRKRRRSVTLDEDNDSDDDILMTGLIQSPKSPRPRRASTSQGDADETPPTSAEDDLDFDDDLAFNKARYQDQVGDQEGSASVDKTALAGSRAESDNEDDARITAPSRRRIRAGFVLDSDSE
jgi:replication fork protection complex subunit Tof1/Swi1